MKTLLALAGILALLISCGGQVPPVEDTGVSAPQSEPQADAQIPSISEPYCVGYSLVHRVYPECPVASNTSPGGEYRSWRRVIINSGCDFVAVGEYHLHPSILISQECGTWTETTRKIEVINSRQCCVTAVKTYTTKLYSRIGRIQSEVKCAGDNLGCVFEEGFGHTYLLDKN